MVGSRQRRYHRNDFRTNIRPRPGVAARWKPITLSAATLNQGRRKIWRPITGGIAALNRPATCCHPYRDEDKPIPANDIRPMYPAIRRQLLEQIRHHSEIATPLGFLHGRPQRERRHSNFSRLEPRAGKRICEDASAHSRIGNDRTPPFVHGGR